MCSYAGNGWRLNNLNEGQSEVSILPLTADITPLSNYEILPEHQIVKHQELKDTLLQAIKLKLPEVSYENFYPDAHGDFLSITVYVLLFGCIVMIVVLIYICYKKNWFKCQARGKASQSNSFEQTIRIPQLNWKLKSKVYNLIYFSFHF